MMSLVLNRSLKKYGATFLLFVLTACASTSTRHLPPSDGVKAGEASSFKNIVPASQLEASAVRQYDAMKQKAAQKNALALNNHPQVIRLRAIAKNILPYAPVSNPDSKAWKWEVNLFVSNEVNAFCMPGGKIAFYTGIIDRAVTGIA